MAMYSGLQANVHSKRRFDGMRRPLIFLISCYKACLSPFMGDNCRFYPSCSTYAQEAIATHGVLKGSYLAVLRIARCHPWHEGGEDPVPPCSHSH